MTYYLGPTLLNGLLLLLLGYLLCCSGDYRGLPDRYRRKRILNLSFHFPLSGNRGFVIPLEDLEAVISGVQEK